MTSTIAPPIKDLQEQARQAYRDSLDAGQTMTRAALGGQFGKSPSWGRDRIREVRVERGLTEETVDMPPAGLFATPDEKGHRPGGTPDMPAATPSVRTKSRRATSTTAPTGAGRQLPPPTGTRVVAWVAFTFGSVVSIAANWLHAWLPAETDPSWVPSIPNQVGAAVWPVALLLSVEVLSRTAWRAGWYWNVVRLGGAGGVALGSALISYGHVRAVLLAWGYDPLGAAVGPLVIDGLMVLAGFALLSMSRPRG